MRTLKRDKKPIYIAKRVVTEDGIEVFSPPLKFDVNVMPAGSNYFQDMMGIVERGDLTFVVDRKDEPDIAVGDRAYVEYQYDKEIFHPYIYDDTYGSIGFYGMSYVEPYGFTTVKEFDGTAQDADYRVDAVLKTPNVINVVLKRLNV